jgi:transketolase
MDWNIGDKIDSRIAYGQALLELGKQSRSVVVLDADLQRSTRTYEFGQMFSDRFFDMGISEADMISTAAGLASTGLIPFANSFAMFLPGRCYDQIRLQIAYPICNVKLCGSSAGLTIGPDGASQQSLDDIALMRALPNMTVIVPADATETYQSVMRAYEFKGPVYIRVSRYLGPVIYDAAYNFQIGIPNLLLQGDELLILATGIMVEKGLRTAELLQGNGYSSALMNISTIKPLAKELVLPQCIGKKLIVTIEEHSIIGGLGSAIAEMLAEELQTPPLLRLGVNDCFGQSGTADDLLEFYGLTSNKIADSILKELNYKKI